MSINRRGRRRSSKSGLPPGTLVYLGQQPAEQVTIHVIKYSEDEFIEDKFSSWQAYLSSNLASAESDVTWINVIGVHDIATIEQIGDTFGLHPLMLEDVVNTHQRPKLEDYNDKLYLVLRMLYQLVDDSTNRFTSEQVSFVLGPNYVLSFQEHDGDVFDSIRERIRFKKGKVRLSGADYLLYRLVDAVVDNYFLVLERIEDDIEETESSIVTASNGDVPLIIYKLKRELIHIRKAVWPLREALSSLVRAENPLLEASTIVFYRDVYDHVIQVIDVVETSRDLITGMLDVHLNSVSNKMNEVMKTLTIIATVFIPLTFIAGVYGMNFAYMPELDWVYGYPALLGIMGTIAVCLIFYFRLKKWL